MWVSTGKAGTPNAWAITTLAVLWPTPGSASSDSESGRHLAAGVDDLVRRGHRFFALVGARPTSRITSWIALRAERRPSAPACRRQREQRRRHLVDLLVGGLRREHDRDEQRERIDVVERDRRIGVQLVEDHARSAQPSPAVASTPTVGGPDQACATSSAGLSRTQRQTESYLIGGWDRLQTAGIDLRRAPTRPPSGRSHAPPSSRRTGARPAPAAPGSPPERRCSARRGRRRAAARPARRDRGSGGRGR